MTTPPTLAALQAQRACVTREVARRQRAAPRLVDHGERTTREAMDELTVRRGVVGEGCALQGDAQRSLLSPAPQARLCVEP